MNVATIVRRPVQLWLAVTVSLLFAHTTPAFAAQRDTRSPSTPTGVTASVTGCGQITIGWNASTDNTNGSGLKGYDVSRNNVVVKFVAAPAASTTDSGLAAGTYTYKVRSVDNAGNVSSWSSNVTATLGVCTTATPRPTATPIRTATATPAATRTATSAATATRTATPATIATPTAVSTPTAPTSLTAAAASCSQINLGWRSSTEPGGSIKGYAVYRKKSTDTLYTYVKDVLAPSVSTSDLALSAGATYNYIVRAFDYTGHYSDTSNVASATTSTCLQTLPTATPTAVATPTSATGAYQWSRRVGALGNDWGGSVAIDKRANCDGLNGTNCVVVAGYVYGTVDLGCGARAAVDALGDDLAVAKYSATGQCLWAKVYGGKGTDRAQAVAVDPTTGDVTITGYSSSTTLDLGTGALPGYGNADIIVASYAASDGTPRWARRIGSTEMDVGEGIAVDASGNVVVVGSFIYSVDFGGGLLTSLGSSEAFVATYSRAGAYVSAVAFPGYGQDAAKAVAVDLASGDVAVAGYFSGNFNLGCGSALSYQGTADIFVAKFTAAGQCRWWQHMGSNDRDEADGVAIDGSGNVVMSGEFRAGVNFGDGTTWQADGAGSGFVAKYTTSGTPQWSRMLGGNAGWDSAASVAADSVGNVVVTGFFRGTTTYPANIGGQTKVSAGDADVFVVKYAPTGGTLWVKTYGSTLADAGRDVAIDGAYNVLVTGSFMNSIDFGGGALTSAGNLDEFTVKLAP